MRTAISWRNVAGSGAIVALGCLSLYQYLLASSPKRLAASDEQIVTEFNRVFHHNADTTWGKNRWLGVLTKQNPCDAWIMQEIFTEVKPEVVVETGSAFGGSAALWASILAQVNPEARVITIDIEDNLAEARKLPIFQQKVDFLLGSSTATEIVAEVTRRVNGRRAVVILDSDHKKAHVLNELKAYSVLVPVGSYLIVQDTNVHGHPVRPDLGPGPWEAVEEFLADNHDFEAERGRERLLLTFNPRGFLKRVR
jgi:cephalosporin hydroxylase